MSDSHSHCLPSVIATWCNVHLMFLETNLSSNIIQYLSISIVPIPLASHLGATLYLNVAGNIQVTHLGFH